MRFEKKQLFMYVDVFHLYICDVLFASCWKCQFLYKDMMIFAKIKEDFLQYSFDCISKVVDQRTLELTGI